MNDFNSTCERLLERVEKAFDPTEPFGIKMMPLVWEELYFIRELLRDQKNRVDSEEYHMGFERGYQEAIKDMIKKVSGLTYGRNNKEKRAAGVPEHHAE